MNKTSLLKTIFWMNSNKYYTKYVVNKKVCTFECLHQEKQHKDKQDNFKMEHFLGKIDVPNVFDN